MFCNPLASMRRSFTKALFIFLVGVAVSVAHAANIAYVDAVALIEQSPQGRMEIKKLDEEFGEQGRQLDADIEKFKEKESEFKKNSVLMSKDEKETAAKELREKGRRLQREREDFTESYNLRRNEGLARLEKLISEVIIAVAKRDGVDLVLQQVVYASEKIDLTPAVLEELTKQAQ